MKTARWMLLGALLGTAANAHAQVTPPTEAAAVASAVLPESRIVEFNPDVLWKTKR